MKVAVINFSGNPGKTTLVDHLLAPRMNAPKFEIETINAGSSADSDAQRLKGKNYGGLQEDLMTLDSAIVDVGASNVEEFIKQMGQFDGSHEEFDYFVAPEKPPDHIHCKASSALSVCWNCQFSLRYVLVSGSFRPCVHAVLPPSSCLPMSCFVRVWRTRSTCAIHWSS